MILPARTRQEVVSGTVDEDRSVEGFSAERRYVGVLRGDDRRLRCTTTFAAGKAVRGAVPPTQLAYLRDFQSGWKLFQTSYRVPSIQEYMLA